MEYRFRWQPYFTWTDYLIFTHLNWVVEVNLGIILFLNFNTHCVTFIFPCCYGILFKTKAKQSVMTKTSLTTSIIGSRFTVSLLMAVVLNKCMSCRSSFITITWSLQMHRVCLRDGLLGLFVGLLHTLWLRLAIAEPYEYPMPELSLARFMLLDK